MRTIRGCRVDRGLTQAEVAKQLSLTLPQYQGFEAVAERLDELAKLYEVRRIRVVIDE